MPRTYGPEHQRKLWAGVGDGLANAVDLVTATAVWAAIGFGLDRLLGTWPILFACGAVVGNMTGAYLLYKKSQRGASDATAARPGAGVSRAWPQQSIPASGGATGGAGKPDGGTE